jgi:hypothetical protein
VAGTGLGHYVAETATIHVSPAVFSDTDMLAHQLAHHLSRAYGLGLDPVEEEILASAFEQVMARARRGEPIRTPVAL